MQHKQNTITSSRKHIWRLGVVGMERSELNLRIIPALLKNEIKNTSLESRTSIL